MWIPCLTNIFPRLQRQPSGCGNGQILDHGSHRMAKPTTLMELQHFLGFASFYRRFIRNYSITAAPLMTLLKDKPSKLKWTDGAIQAFSNLKYSFTTAPILKHPDPNLPFRLEVDATDYQASFSLVLTFQENSWTLSIIMMSETRNYWLWRRPLKNGVTGWRVPLTPSR